MHRNPLIFKRVHVITIVLKEVHMWGAILIAIAYVLFPAYGVATEKNHSHKIEQEGPELKGPLPESEELEEKEETEERPTVLKYLADKVTLSASAEFGFEYTDVSDTGDENSGSASDLFVDTLELALEFAPNEWVRLYGALIVEDMFKQGDREKVSLDEAFLTLKCPWAPLFLTGGLKDLPFGVFEDYMISGTLTEELYEINAEGITFGFSPDFYGLTTSVSVYQGQHVIDNLETFGTHEFKPASKRNDDAFSFIGNITLEPFEMVTWSAFFDSEPGDRNRNQSIGSALTLDFWKFSLDAEYITALEREEGANGEETKESAWTVGLAFKPLDSLVLATRYEVLDDDRAGAQDEMLKYSYLAGFNYKFLEYAIFSFEYKYSRFEKERGSNAADDQNEINLRLILEY